jgi:hypothetical protein
MLGTDLVWARDPHEGYIQGRITELGAHEYEVLPVDRAHQKRTCSIDDIFPSCEAKSDHDDNCEISNDFKSGNFEEKKLNFNYFRKCHSNSSCCGSSALRKMS